ncbi:DUF4145 domain-containing protein [bacterium]|nr:DUF4145 domain-containing protein [bacterium]
MTELIANCPRCRVQKITFDLKSAIVIDFRHEWQNWYEAFCVCRNCKKSTVFVLSESVRGNYQELHHIGLLSIKLSANNYVDVEGFINTSNYISVFSPDHVPEEERKIFLEGSCSFSVGCYNASAAMFRLCLDILSKKKLKKYDESILSNNVKQKLSYRLNWLFEQKVLPADLKDMSECIREDGNDGAHTGNIKKEEAEDLMDFTRILLEKVYTEPRKVEIAKERRDERRGNK